MKRSEMIKKLEDQFGGEVREFSSNILEFLEQQGMSPPSYSGKGIDHEEGYVTYILYLGKWEQEDV